MRHLTALLKLKNEKKLNYSQVPKTLLNELLDEGLIEIKTISGNKKKVLTKELFFTVYNNLEAIQDSNTRAQLIQAKTDTKQKKISPMDGLYVNGRCSIEGLKLPLFNKSALFFKELPKIDKEILVIGVENFENLIYFEKQLSYFRDNEILFVYRNQKMLEFLENIENNIIYFSDFDLAGINIFLSEIKPRNSKIELFIPHNINLLISEYGSKKLYAKQLNRYKNTKSEDKTINNLISFIHKEQKVLEQEFFILESDFD